VYCFLRRRGRCGSRVVRHRLFYRRSHYRCGLTVNDVSRSSASLAALFDVRRGMVLVLRDGESATAHLNSMSSHVSKSARNSSRVQN
jgi:hypothetical protein